MDFSNIPVLWQRTSPEEVACSISDDKTTQNAVAKAIQEERRAARPYVQSCTDARWADEPGIQQRIHAITLNGVDVTIVCVGFNTAEGWVELLITAGQHPDGRPRAIFNQDRRQPAPLTVRVCGNVQVIMTGALNQVYDHADHAFAG